MGHLRLGAALAASVSVLVLAFLVPVPAYAAPTEESTLPRVNQFTSCTPAPEHQRPVVLVHGNGSGMAATWRTLSKRLSDSGFCVFALDYGRHQPGSDENLLDLAGGSDIGESADVLAAFISKVRSATAADKVDVVAHSMGALTARHYLKFVERNTIHTVVSVGGTNHGSTFESNTDLPLGSNSEIRRQAVAAGLPADEVLAAAVGPAYAQQMTGSSFLTQLNAGGDTVPGVDYVAVATRGDEVVTPPESAFLTAGPGATVRNVWVQDGCPGLAVDHMGLTTHPRSLWLIHTALDPDHSDTMPAPCP